MAIVSYVKVLLLVRVHTNSVFLYVEVILKTILEHGRDVVTPYTNQQKGMPDPSYVLTLPGDVLYGSNVYGVQKHFDGPFQFDVIFDSASNTQKITRTTIILDTVVLY